MTEKKEAKPQERPLLRKGPFIAFLLVLALIGLVLVGIAIAQSVQADRIDANAVSIIQMSDAEILGLSVDEIQDARQALAKVQGSDSYPAATIERELQELDVILDQKLTAGS